MDRPRRRERAAQLDGPARGAGRPGRDDRAGRGEGKTEAGERDGEVDGPPCPLQGVHAAYRGCEASMRVMHFSMEIVHTYWNRARCLGSGHEGEGPDESKMTSYDKNTVQVPRILCP